MEVDLEGAPAQTYKSQVCIAGAGIAGLVLATALAEKGIDVHLLEAGGKTLEERSQALYQAAMLGGQHRGTTEGRFRVFGGSSTRWGAQLLPYSSDIFRPPDAVPSPAWPLSEADVQPYYARVEATMGVDSLPYSDELYSLFGMDKPPLAELVEVRFSKWAPFTRRNLARTLGNAAVASGKITVFYHANATDVVLLSAGAVVEAMEVRNYQGACFRFEASQFVLAVGAIETSRLLLASRMLSERGVGSGQVGRGLHDHVSYEAAVLRGEARTKMLRWFAPFLKDGTLHTAKLEAMPELRRELGMQAVMAHVVIAEPEDSGAGVVRAVLQSVQRREKLADMLYKVAALPGASVDVGRLLWSAQVRKRRAVSDKAVVALRIDCEQRPGSDNRVSVDREDRDVLGMPKAIVDWRVGADEYATIRRYARFMRGALAAMGVADAVWKAGLADEDDEAPLDAVTDTYHMMGGALMGTDAAASVVDPELRMHGVPNLSIASCAVFPAGGSSNPTFTLMALCYRLAERLGREL